MLDGSHPLDFDGAADGHAPGPGPDETRAPSIAELVASQRGLLRHLAARHRVGGIRTEDLEAEGMLGLLEAARRFDPAVGARFSTYARHWARAFMQRHVHAHRRIVAMPDTRAARSVLGRGGRMERQLHGTLGRAPTEEELAAAIGVALDDLTAVRGYQMAHDVRVGPASDDDASFDPASPTADPETLLADAEAGAALSEAVAHAMVGLPERERHVVARRFLEETPPTHEALGAELHVSRERARQLEARGLAMLRAALAPSVASSVGERR